jgi:hypothetical protein
MMHVWATSGRGVSPMTGCAIYGPVLPLGHLARRREQSARRDAGTCPGCAHLEVCGLQPCPMCDQLAADRAAVAARLARQATETAGAAARVRLVYAADLEQFTTTPSARTTPTQPAPAAVPGGVGNPEPVRMHVEGRGEVDGYRFHLVDGTKPRTAAKPVRKAVHGLRGYLRDTFTIVVGGDGTRSISIAPDIRDLSPDRWQLVIAAAAGELGWLLAAAVPAAGRHIEVFPF